MNTQNRRSRPTAGDWKRTATIQTLHGGSVLLTWGVIMPHTVQWVGVAHGLGATPEQQAEAYANAGLFAASKTMATILVEATEAWAKQFEFVGDEDCSISGADLLDWFAQWRRRAKAALDEAGTP
jgi:hypothetical protein